MKFFALFALVTGYFPAKFYNMMVIYANANRFQISLNARSSKVNLKAKSC